MWEERPFPKLPLSPVRLIQVVGWGGRKTLPIPKTSSSILAPDEVLTVSLCVSWDVRPLAALLQAQVLTTSNVLVFLTLAWLLPTVSFLLCASNPTYFLLKTLQTP